MHALGLTPRLEMISTPRILAIRIQTNIDMCQHRSQTNCAEQVKLQGNTRRAHNILRTFAMYTHADNPDCNLH